MRSGLITCASRRLLSGANRPAPGRPERVQQRGDRRPAAGRRKPGLQRTGARDPSRRCAGGPGDAASNPRRRRDPIHRHLLRRLTGGRWAGQVEVATTLARNACYLSFPNDRGFATPVLFLRGEGRLFETRACRRRRAPPMDAVTLAPEVTAMLIQHLTQQGTARDRSRGAALRCRAANRRAIPSRLGGGAG